MADLLNWVVMAFGIAGGMAFGRIWGRILSKRTGKREAELDAFEDKTTRMERGRAALQDGRGAGDPADRLHRNDRRW